MLQCEKALEKAALEKTTLKRIMLERAAANYLDEKEKAEKQKPALEKAALDKVLVERAVAKYMDDKEKAEYSSGFNFEDFSVERPKKHTPKRNRDFSEIWLSSYRRS